MAMETDRPGPHFPAGERREVTVDTQLDKGLVVVAFGTEDLWDIRRTRRLSQLGQVFSDRLREEIRERLGASYSPVAHHWPSRAYEGYGMLIDVGHMNMRLHGEAYFAGQSVRDYLAAAGRPIFEVHLHDNDGRADQHLPLGRGTIDFSLLQGVTDGVPILEAYGDLDELRQSAERWQRQCKSSGGGQETLPNGGQP